MKNLQQLHYETNLADAHQLEPADVLVVPKSGINLIKHMIIYAGIDAHQNHWYLENNPQSGKHSQIRQTVCCPVMATECIHQTLQRRISILHPRQRSIE